MATPSHRRAILPRLVFVLAGFALSLALVPEGRSFDIVGAAWVTEGLRLEWTTRPGRHYAVESAPTVNGPWSTRFERDADADRLSWIDADPRDGIAARLYRVAETEPPSSVTAGPSLVLADQLPIQVSGAFAAQLEMCASAVYLASTLRGGVVTTTGTLNQGMTGWTYEATPADSLAVRFSSGTNLTYRLRELRGDFAGDVSNFLGNGHDFVFDVTQPGAFDLTLESRRPAGRCNIVPSGAVTGSFVLSNVTYTLDLRATGPYCFEVDLSGFSLLEDYRTTGTITAPGFRLAVDYRRRYEDVGSGQTDASTEQVWLAHRLEFGGEAYLWEGVKRQKSFRNGKVNDWEPPGYWSASGNITRNGEVVARYEYLPATPQTDLFLRFVLALGNDRVELERWFLR